jgi:soluble lytic murein transglycosylase-like protein
MEYLLKKYKGNMVLVLAAYNWGETNVDKLTKPLNASSLSEANLRQLFKNNKETNAYLQKILD